MEAVEQFEPPPACPNWCFMTFPSRMVSGWPYPNMSKPFIGRNPVDYAWIEKPSLVYKKSLAQSRNTFLLGFHEHGSCRAPDGRLDAPHARGNKMCAKVATSGFMRHYLFRFRRHPAMPDTLPEPDDFARLVLNFPGGGHLKMYGMLDEAMRRRSR
jgi:hypothetical protein